MGLPRPFTPRAANPRRSLGSASQTRAGCHNAPGRPPTLASAFNQVVETMRRGLSLLDDRLTNPGRSAHRISGRDYSGLGGSGAMGSRGRAASGHLVASSGRGTTSRGDDNPVDRGEEPVLVE